MLVVGRHGGKVIGAAPPGVTAIRARNWRGGIAHSLHAALDALEGYVQVEAVCIGLADQPLIAPEAYRRLAAAHAAGATLAVATYGAQRANPVLIARPLWTAARRLRGDTGARALMRDHDVTEVDCTDAGNPVDVDTLADLRALEESGLRPGASQEPGASQKEDGDAHH